MIDGKANVYFDNGTVSVCANIGTRLPTGEIVAVLGMNTCPKCEIGKIFYGDDICYHPEDSEVVLYFESTKSIDVVIKKLEFIRRCLEDKINENLKKVECIKSEQ